MKRKCVIVGALCLAMVISAAARQHDSHSADKFQHWVGTWASSPQIVDKGSQPPAPGFTDATLRQIVHVSIGGKNIRLRFSNDFGSAPLTIDSAHVALSADESKIVVASDKALNFNGQPSVTIPPGAEMISDPLDFDLAPGADLAISIYLKSAPESITTHPGSRETSYIQSGDVVTAAKLPTAAHTDHWYYINGVDVIAPDSSAAIVALGDSITDGHGATTNGNDRWTDDLARRLAADRHIQYVSMLNEGIGGNRLRHDGLGPNALARFGRDVLEQTSVRWLIVFEGVNDIGTRARAEQHHEQAASADDIIAAYEQVIDRAHAHHIRVYGATITPFGGSFYDSHDAQNVWNKVNDWIRTSGKFDAVIDFAAVVRDPKDPSRLAASADSGDHLHPGKAGYQAMADSIDLKLFEK